MLLLQKLKQAYVKFNGKFTYDMLQATRVIDYIRVTCPIHGDFTQELRVHLKSIHGCPKCGNMHVSNTQRKTQEQYIAEAKTAHNNKYDYSLTVYKGDSSKVVIICPVHGKFTQQAGSHIGKSKCGCKKCAIKAETEKQKLSLIEVTNRINVPKHINVDINSYIGTKTKMKCSCEYHGEFLQLPEILFKGNSAVCPTCAKQLRGWNRSLYKNSPTTVYLLLLTNGTYKLGITKSCNVYTRYSPHDRALIQNILFQVTILNGEIAWNIEKQVLREMKQHKYSGPQIFKDTGNTEIFTVNPIQTLTKVINEQILSV